MSKFIRSRGAFHAAMYGLILSIALSFFAASSAQAAEAMFQFKQQQFGLSGGTAPPAVGPGKFRAEWLSGLPLTATIGSSTAQPTSLLGATPRIAWPASLPNFYNNSVDVEFGGGGYWVGGTTGGMSTMGGKTISGAFGGDGIPPFQATASSAFGFYFNIVHNQISNNEAAYFTKNHNFGSGSPSQTPLNNSTYRKWGVPLPSTDPTSPGVITNGWPTGTTRCAAILGITTGGSGMLPAEDQCIKAGHIEGTAGAKKFGGTAQVVANVVDVAVQRTLPTFVNFQKVYFAAGSTTSKVGVPQRHPSMYIANGGIYVSNTNDGYTKRSLLGALGGGHTTGQARVSNTAGFGITNFTAEGYNNFNAANLTGTMLLIQPVIGNSFTTINNIPTGALGGGSAASVRRTWLTFAPVPEPGTMALLGAGVLGLAGIYARRRN